MMRRLLSSLLCLLILAAGYLLSPLYIAMDLRRAVLTGDKATLEARVEWPAVRQSLKDSLAELDRAKQTEQSARGLPSPTLWSRIKAAASPSRYADQIIDRYVTPDGVAGLSTARGTLRALTGSPRDSQAGEHHMAEEALPLTDRAVRFWNRLKRIEILSPTDIEIEMADRRVPERSYVGTLSFATFRWRVTSVKVRGVGF